MITVIGKMVVNTVRGKNGPFNTASLYTQIGDFIVRYDGLDEFDIGTYQGEFIIRKIETRIRPFGVSRIIEQVAHLDGLNLYDAVEGKTDPVPTAIPDPLEEEDVGKSTRVPKSVQKPKQEAEADNPDDAIKQLFDGIWPLADEVKLDPTVGREKLRLQANHLKNTEYRYNSIEQIWRRKH